MAAERKGLPADFAHWALPDCDGSTVAHRAAWLGTLPVGFLRWELRDQRGFSVAFVAAMYGHLPREFAAWEVTNADGMTAAHGQAIHRGLPEGFYRWDIFNPATDAHFARLPADVQRRAREEANAAKTPGRAWRRVLG
jgi:hypothetical protein